MGNGNPDTRTKVHLVTGANGRTGAALCAELKSRGHSVRALIREGARKYLPFLNQYVDQVVFGDICDPASLNAAFDGADYVYHLAGIVSIASRIDTEIQAVNITGVQNVINACIAHHVTRLVHTGTIHTIPFHDTTSILREFPSGVPFEPTAVHGAYAVSKAIGSNLVLDAVRNHGLNAVIGMPSGIVGGFELKRSNFGKMVVDVAERRLPVYVTGRYDFVDVKDVARALADLADAGPAGETYIISGHIVTVADLIHYAARAAGVKPPRVCLPLGLVKIFGYPAEWYSRARHETLMFTPYAMKVLGDNCHFSHEKLTALTGYAPGPIDAAIAEQVAFYRTVYKPLFANEVI